MNNDDYLIKMDRDLFAIYGKYFARAEDQQDNFGFGIGAGWYPIIGALLEGMAAPIQRAERALDVAEKNMAKGATKHTWDRDYDKFTEAPWCQADVDAARDQLTILQASLPKIQQVKEKFGTLRFYVNSADDVTRALIDMAESLSTITCEVCGNRGTMRKGGWLRVLCNQHAEAGGYFSKDSEK